MRLPLAIALTTLAALASLVPAQTQPKPPFTIGKETTVVDGPLRRDGTIDYVSAINAILSKGVTRENNAAIPLLQATTPHGEPLLHAELIKELKIELPQDPKVALVFIWDFANPDPKKPVSTAEMGALDEMVAKCKDAPWKKEDAPLVAAWIESSQKGLALVENACAKPRLFLPWVPRKPDGSWIDAMPVMGMARMPGEVLLPRAMLRAGSGDMPGALKDLKTARTLAQLVAQQRTTIDLLVAVAIESQALRGFDALATSGICTAQDLKAMRVEILALPELPGPDAANQLEELLTLDTVMMCIRGDVEKVLRGLAGIIDESAKIDLGDLPKADWDVVLKTVHGCFVDDGKNLSFEERLKDYDAKIEAAKADKMPASFLSSADLQPGAKGTEEFLKLRPGETREAFSKRVGRWLASGDPGMGKNADSLTERGRLDRKLALVAISLAEYHLAHGAYPESLKELGEPVLHDPFSGKDVIYHREGTGYVLGSLGVHQKGENGQGFDRPIRAEK